nr:MAG TPA: hypothetical protein [Bacteriophage sp.]
MGSCITVTPLIRSIVLNDVLPLLVFFDKS